MTHHAAKVISAIITPLTDTDELHEEGLRRHLASQWDAGIDGVLVAGSMGMMQLLGDETYRNLVKLSAEVSRGHGEVFIGVGETSLRRTLDRVEWADRFGTDGLVVLTPFFQHFSEAELLDYYCTLADGARTPIYLYDLPQRVGQALPHSLLLRLSEHPNIAGVKCSGPVEETLKLIAAAPPTFRVIIAHPRGLGELIRKGYRDHLDGIFAIAPKWTVALRDHASRGEWQQAAEYQEALAQLLSLLIEGGVMAVATVLLNALGTPGRCMPRPGHMLDAAGRERVLAHPITQRLLAEATSRLPA